MSITLEDISILLSPTPLTIQDLQQYYVNLVDARGDNPIASLKRRLNKKTNGQLQVLFSGYRGCGKSTELNKLQSEINKDFIVLNFSVLRELDPINMNYVELFILTMEKLFEIVEKYNIDISPTFLKSIKAWTQTEEIEKIRSTSTDISVEAGVETNLGLPWFTNFFAKIRAAGNASFSAKPTVFFVYALAKNLHNLGLLYASVQKMAQAEVIYQEALRIFRGLAAENPDTFLCDVANTLNGLGNYYSTNTKIPQAEAAFQEALGIYRNLATKNPDIFLPHLAETLIRLGTFYARNKNIAEAEAAYLEAETLFRQLVNSNSKNTLYSFIILLTNLATFYHQTFPHKEKSVAYSNEVISLASPLVATMPEMKEYIETVTKYI